MEDTCERSGTTHLFSPSTNLTKGLMARRLFIVPPCHEGTFTNIHVFAGIQTQALRRSIQRRYPLYRMDDKKMHFEALN
ncbi:hypothetical protein TNCV_1968621 [Trichonephila clavipes]|nr:hypothetical protein TNCV_1968621 [Trichonephila clavipes]